MTDDIAIEIVEAVAEAEALEPSDLDLVVGEYVDLDALSQLAAHDGATWTFTFDLPAHEVTVTDNGRVVVDDHPEEESKPV